MASSTCVTLSNGVRMPLFGLGTWQSKPGEMQLAVTAALDAGYRLIDTAAIYENEADIGDTLQKYLAQGKLKRADLFITTKAWCTHNRPEQVEQALRESLRKLKTDYVDLFLVHQPAAFNADMTEHEASVKVEDTWRGMEQVYEKGLAKAIGVSNFSEEQIERVLKSGKVPVHNSQVELHLYFQQKAHVDFCQRHNISVTAYAPIGSPGRSKFELPNGRKLEWPAAVEPLENEQVLGLAKKYGKSPAQVLLRHLLQKNIAVIPKSTNAKRIAENAQVFDFQLSADEMASLDAQPQGNRLFLQDFMIGHPEDPWKEERPMA